MAKTIMTIRRKVSLTYTFLVNNKKNALKSTCHTRLMTIRSQNTMRD